MKENGQILIIMLLVMIVGLTIGLLLLGRTTTDLSVSNKLEDSSRAFNAAEAGIEDAIYVGGVSSPLPLPSGVGYSVNLSNLTAGNNVLFPSGTAAQNKPTDLGDIFTVWLIPHNDATGALNEAGTAYRTRTIDVCFSTNTPIPAIGVNAYYKDSGGNYRTSATGYDPSASRAATNKFRATAGTLGGCGGSGYGYRASVNLQTDFAIDITAAGTTPLALRIRPYYASTTIAVIPASNTLPKQGNQIVSTGTAGQTASKISVNEKYIMPAPFLDDALYNSGTSTITK